MTSHMDRRLYQLGYPGEREGGGFTIPAGVEP